MKKQIIPKVIVVLALSASGYITFNLLVTYIAAISGRLVGAGAAQWQFAFLLAPVPIACGLLGLGVACWVRPRLSRSFIVLSSVATATPMLLLGLVLMHAY
ncbi:MAG: hypothetical protein WCB49_07185 [Gammaproteobacteria bacterium]